MLFIVTLTTGHGESYRAATMEIEAGNMERAVAAARAQAADRYGFEENARLFGIKPAKGAWL